MSSLAILAPYTLAPTPDWTVTDLERLSDLAIGSLRSAASQRNYRRELIRFIKSGRELTRDGVLAHVAAIRNSGVGAVSVNVALAAIKLLCREAELRNILSPVEAGAIDRVRSEPIRGTKLGNWLTLDEARVYLEAVGARSARDAALIAVMLGCGLRRGEVSGLDWGQFVKREGRWVWSDVKGKGGKVRTVPCPEWASEYILQWKLESELKEKESEGEDK